MAEENNILKDFNPEKENNNMGKGTDSTAGALSDIDSYIATNSDVNVERIFNPDDSTTIHPGMAQGISAEGEIIETKSEGSHNNSSLEGGPAQRIPGNQGTGTDLSGQGTPGARDASQIDEESANDMPGAENNNDIGTASAGAGLGGNAGRGTASGDRK